MVMNTSFNLAGMPIVESPTDALSCFLDADPDLSVLVLYGRVFRRRSFPDGAEAAASMVPQQQRSFISRCMSDPMGGELGVEVLVEEKWTALTDALELEVLERCASGDLTVRQLAADLSVDSDGQVSENDVMERVRNLFKLRLVSI